MIAHAQYLLVAGVIAGKKVVLVNDEKATVLQSIKIAHGKGIVTGGECIKDVGPQFIVATIGRSETVVGKRVQDIAVLRQLPGRFRSIAVVLDEKLDLIRPSRCYRKRWEICSRCIISCRDSWFRVVCTGRIRVSSW